MKHLFDLVTESLKFLQIIPWNGITCNLHYKFEQVLLINSSFTLDTVIILFTCVKVSLNLYRRALLIVLVVGGHYVSYHLNNAWQVSLSYMHFWTGGPLYFGDFKKLGSVAYIPYGDLLWGASNHVMLVTEFLVMSLVLLKTYAYSPLFCPVAFIFGLHKRTTSSLNLALWCVILNFHDLHILVILNTWFCWLFRSYWMLQVTWQQ